MTELRILFAAASADNLQRIVDRLHLDGCVISHAHAADAATLEAELQKRWDALIVLPSPDLSLPSVVEALRSRELDIPSIVVKDDVDTLNLSEAMYLGAKDCLSCAELDRLLPSIQREMVSTILRSNLREQLVTEHLLQEIDRLILSGCDLQPLVDRICRRMVELFDFKLVWIGSKMPDGSVEVVAAAGDLSYLNGINVRWDSTPQGQGTTGLAIRENRPVVLTVDSPRFAEWRERAERHGMRSILSMPLGIQGEIAGALMMYSAHGDAFDKLTVLRLSAFAERVTVAILAAQEQQELRLMHAAMSNAANAMFITRCDGTIEWLNDALSSFSGYSVAEITGSNPRVFSSGQHDREFWRNMWSTILAGKPWRGDVINRNKSGELYTVTQSISPLFNDKGELTHFLAVQQDISEKKLLEERIRYLAYHDPLTDLPNRMLFQDRVQQAVNQAQRSGDKLAVMFIDLDGFKAVNDTRGHNNGDALLVQVSERIRSCVRSGDTVARLGGDEFTVLLQDIGSMENIQKVAQKLLDVAAQPYRLACPEPASISLSIGISLYPEHGTNFDALLSHADQAMYEAKQGGKNRYSFFRGI